MKDPVRRNGKTTATSTAAVTTPTTSAAVTTPTNTEAPFTIVDYCNRNVGFIECFDAITRGDTNTGNKVNSGFCIRPENLDANLNCRTVLTNPERFS